MIKLHTMPADPGKTQTTKRLGRGEGSGRGKTAGKGHKGKQARSGAGKGAYFEGGQMPLVRRMPKFGFSNTSFKPRRTHLNLDVLERHFGDGDVVDFEALRTHKLVSIQTKQVKILAGGTLTRKLHIKAYGFSAGARAAIEAAGGTCETIG